MNKKHGITSFYLETLLLIAVFIGVIMLLTQVFGAAKMASDQAEILTKAVGLAQNGAEAVAASKGDPELLVELLEENGNMSELKGAQDKGYYFSFNDALEGDPSGLYSMYIGYLWDGDMLNSIIRICYDGAEEPVYSIKTALYIGEVF